MKKIMISLTILLLLVGCGGGSSKSKGEKIDLTNYFPQKNMEKRFKEIIRNGTNFEDLETEYYTESIAVSNVNQEKGTRTITTTSNGNTKETTVINEENIVVTDEDNETITLNRNVHIGDTVMSETKKNSKEEEIGTITYDLKMNCKLQNKLTEFQKNDNKYTGDILEIKCITSGKIDVKVKESLAEFTSGVDGSHDMYDVSYSYIKKDIGDIAYINENCVSEDDKMELPNDTKGCTVTEKEYNFYEGA
jgi:uncharacterized protein YxeA